MKGQTKQDKLVRLAGRLALSIAKERGDVKYEKYRKYRKAMLAVKKDLLQKYEAAGMKAAKKAISN
jgi:hypothetical protein